MFETSEISKSAVQLKDSKTGIFRTLQLALLWIMSEGVIGEDRSIGRHLDVTSGTAMEMLTGLLWDR